MNIKEAFLKGIEASDIRLAKISCDAAPVLWDGKTSRFTDAPAQIYSCQAECLNDVLDVLSRSRIYKPAPGADENDINHATIHAPESDFFSAFRLEYLGGFSAPVLEFVSYMTLDEARQFIGRTDDSHVMQQTLRPVALQENSLERDWSVTTYYVDGDGTLVGSPGDAEP